MPRGERGGRQLLRECNHDNIVRLVKEIIRHHREKLLYPLKEYTVKSLLWQVLNGLNYLHSNWFVHRDLKPANILVMGNEGEEPGVVKIGDFGLARIFQAPLKPLWDNGVVVTIWYRCPELLLGSKHYTCAVDMWAVGCIFAELLTLKPLFQGVEDKGVPNPFQVDQLDKIFRVLGSPSVDRWPALQHLSHWQSNRQSIQSRRYEQGALSSIVQLPPKSPALDLMARMLEYDPLKRITAAQALEHDYFHLDPLPGKNALMGGHPGDKPVAYPSRPVDVSTDFEGSQTGAAGQGPSHHAAARANAGLQHPALAALPRSGAGAPSLLGPHPSVSAGGGMHGQRGLGSQQQQQQARMKERAASTYGGHPPAKSRRL